MPRKRPRQSQRIQQLEDELAMSRLQARQSNGYTSHPLPRPATAGWDWHCHCGRLNYSGRPSCYGCFGPRKHGATFVGSLRGVPQNTPAARLAVASQARVPESRPLGQPTTRVQQPVPAPTAAANATQRPAAPTKRILQQSGVATAATSVARGSVGAGGGYASAVIGNAKSNTLRPASTATDAKPPPTSEKVSGELPQSASAIMEADNEAQMHADAEEADIEPDPTIAEDLGYDEIRKRLLKCETALRKRQKRHEKELNAVQEMEQYIDEQRSQLAVLQSKADATGSEIHDFAATIASLSARSTELAAERSKALEAKADSPTGQQHQQTTKDGALYARQVVGDIIAGVHNFSNETPEVQLILQQFVAYLDQLRPTQPGTASAAPPQNSAALLAPAQAPTCSVVAPTAAPAVALAPACFDISDTQQTASPMVVVGHSVGDKRKREHLLDAERQSAEKSDEDVTGDEAGSTPTVAPTQVTAAESADTEIATSTPAAPAACESDSVDPGMQYSFGSTWRANTGFVQMDRASLRKQLMDDNKKQASERKARSELAHRTSNPY